PAVTRCMHEAKAEEPVRIAIDDCGDLAVCSGVIRRERRKEHAVGNPGLSSSREIVMKGRVGVPRAGQTVSFSGMAMRVDDHVFAISSRKAALVAIARNNIESENRSFGACGRSSGRANPISTVGIESISANAETTGMLPPSRTKVGETPKPR